MTESSDTQIDPELARRRAIRNFYARTYRAKHKDKIRESNRQQYMKNRERRLEYERNREKLQPQRNLARRREKKYGITKEQYENLRAAQNYCCAICGAHEETGTHKCLFVDHDHARGHYRGLLCGKCNSMLGYANESTEILSNAAAYLEKWKRDDSNL